jgi:hypothetical protein
MIVVIVSEAYLYLFMVSLLLLFTRGESVLYVITQTQQGGQHGIEFQDRNSYID